MKIYVVTRIVKETTIVEAKSKKEAIAKVCENGSNWDAIVLKESAKEC